MQKKMHIKRKFIISITLIFILCLLVISSISYVISYYMLLNKTKSKIEIVSQMYSQQINSWLISQGDKLHEINENFSLDSNYFNDENRILKILQKKYKNSDDSVYDYYIGFENKKLLFGSGWVAPYRYDCTKRKWYKEAMAKNKRIYTDPYLDADSKKMVITIAEPIVINGNVIGVIAADIMVDYLVQLVNEIKVEEESYAFLIDNNKKFMTHPLSAFLPTSTETYSIESVLDGKYTKLANQIDNEMYDMIELKDYDNKDKYFILVNIDSTDWKLGFSISKSVVTKELKTLLIGFLLVLIISIPFIIAVVYFLINKLLESILILTDKVKQFGIGNMDVRCEIFDNDEIGQLGKSFNNMADIIQEHSITLEKKVEERTKELKEKNLKIKESIEYAKIIQEAILPSEVEVEKILKNHFIIWKPRDIVGGDFYWIRQYTDGITILVGDCTGHGVPGALMTMVSKAILEHVMENICHNDPAAILKELSNRINQMLRREKKENNIHDGLDAGIIYLPNKGDVLFSGAQLSLFAIKNNEVQEIKGSRQTIGYNSIEKNFINHNLKREGLSALYMLTDGVKDQVGGEKRLPFGKKRFMKIIKSTNHLSMEEQKNNIWKNFETYVKDEELRDDITIIGFKL